MQDAPYLDGVPIMITRRAGALRRESSGSRIVSVRLLGSEGKLLMTVRLLARNIETSGQNARIKSQR